MLTAEENRTLGTLMAGMLSSGQTGTAAISQRTAAQDEKPIQITTQVMLDGNKVGESVTTYQKNRERAMGR